MTRMGVPPIEVEFVAYFVEEVFFHIAGVLRVELAEGCHSPSGGDWNLYSLR